MPGNDYSIATISQYVGQELGVSEWITINQERIKSSKVTASMGTSGMARQNGLTRQSTGSRSLCAVHAA